MERQTTNFFWNIVKILSWGMIYMNSLMAIPRFAIMNGTSCRTCHMNPTGSGLRNDYGITIFSMEELPLALGKDKSDNNFSGIMSDYFQLGTDLRFQFFGYSEGDTIPKMAIFPMQSDLYGHVKIHRRMEVYIEMDLLRGSSEFWTLFTIIPNGGYVQVGKKIPHYGLPLDDHTSFIRGGNLRRTYGLTKEGMPFSPFVSIPGMIEIGINLSDFFITTSISNGYVLGRDPRYGYGESISDKTFTGRIEYSKAFDTWTLLTGGSMMKEQKFSMWGFFGGLSHGNLSWEGEVDVAEEWVDIHPSLASYSQFAWMIFQGLHLLIKYDFFDLNVSRKGDWISRLTGGVEFFPFSFLEIKAQVRITNTSRLERTSKPEFLIQFHTWY